MAGLPGVGGRKGPAVRPAPPALFSPQGCYLPPGKPPGLGRENHLPAAPYLVVKVMGRAIQTATGVSPSLAGPKRT